jgi:hypothetical protein
MYTQAFATIALCEAVGLTQDPAIKKQATLAIDYIVKGQAADGSWGYTAGTAGDTSIVGWQIQALKAARLANITVPQKCFDNAITFLESVSGDQGATYGYRTKGSSGSLTAVGLHCRMFTGWTPRNTNLRKGATFLIEKYPVQANRFDLYYYYYATQLFRFIDDDTWKVKWNPAMQKLLLGKQTTEKTPSAKAGEIGAWGKDDAHIGSHCGKLGSTALACLILESYYRFPPLYKRDLTGLSVLDEKK